LGMSTARSHRTIGEIIFAIVLSAVAAAIAAAAGFVGAALLCAKLLSGEAGEASLVLAPATAVVLAMVAFYICFRKIITYGDSS
jgi:ABC-type nickel/cobalt efflux system permease component RcnA